MHIIAGIFIFSQKNKNKKGEKNFPSPPHTPTANIFFFPL